MVLPGLFTDQAETPLKFLLISICLLSSVFRQKLSFTGTHQSWEKFLLILLDFGFYYERQNCVASCCRVMPGLIKLWIVTLWFQFWVICCYLTQPIWPSMTFIIFFLDFVPPQKRNMCEGCWLFTLKMAVQSLGNRNFTFRWFQPIVNTGKKALIFNISA